MIFSKNSIILFLSIISLSACAAQSSGSSKIPPPSLPVSSPQGKVCGGFRQSPQSQCSVNEYCHRTVADMCGAADAPGTCRPVPEMCTFNYVPVCGCDGQTYSNECSANSKAVSAAYLGVCK